MTDATESKPDIISGATEATPAAIESAAAAEPVSAASRVNAEPALNAVAAEPGPTTPTHEAPPVIAPTVAHTEPPPAAATATAAGDGLLKLRPGFDFTKLRPDLGKFRPNLRKFVPSPGSTKVAASLGFACALGLLLGAIGSFGIGHLLASPQAATMTTKSAAATNETRALKRNVAQIEAQLAALKTSVDRSNQVGNSQRAKLAQSYERDTRAQTDMQTRMNKIGETVDRLERRMAIAMASDATGSVTPQRTAAGSAPAPLHVPAPTPAPVRTATAAPAPAPAPTMAAKTASMPPIAEGWAIRDVFQGRALVASRRGVFEAAPGLELPGLGQVESIKRQDGQWVVVTQRGLIVASRGARTHYRFED